MRVLIALSIIITILKYGADIGESVSGGEHLIHIATIFRQTHFIQALIDKDVNLDVNHPLRGTSLHIASNNGHKETVIQLLQAGANPNIIRPLEQTSPLFMASQHGYTDIIQILLQHKAQVDAPFENGITPLIVAAQNGHLETVKCLLRWGADINACQKSGEYAGATALISAASNNKIDVVSFLLQEGADYTLQLGPKYGYTALDIAKKNNLHLIVNMLEQWQWRQSIPSITSHSRHRFLPLRTTPLPSSSWSSRRFAP